MTHKIKHFLLIIFCTFFSFVSNGQSFENKGNYDSLIVNTWKIEAIEINEKNIELTQMKKDGSFIFLKKS